MGRPRILSRERIRDTALDIVDRAGLEGLSMRNLAADLGVNLRKLDRMIARAKAEGLLDGVVIPRRPQPQQRDALRARHEAELWLDTHGPHAE